MRKIPRLGLLVGLLLVGALVVAALPVQVLASDVPWAAAGDVTLDGADAPVGTVINVYLGADVAPIATYTVTTAGEYGPVDFWASPSRYGEAFRYTVDTFSATTVPASPVFGTAIYLVDLTAVSEEAPEVTTDTATSVHHNSATLRGTLDDLGDFTSVDVYFEYGLTTGYGIPTSLVTQNAIGSFSAPISGLDPDTEYHFMAVGRYDSQYAVGLDMTFTTAEEPVWPYELPLGDGLNIISTPVWLDSASDTVPDIIPTGSYTGGYRWTGTSFTSLSSYYVWKPLEAFYVYVDAGTTATFVPTTDRKAPNTRTLASNKWYLIGSSPFGGSGCQTMDDVLVNLASNWSIVVQPTAANQTGDFCTVNNPTALTLCAYDGAFVYVGAGTTRTIVGFCTMPVE